MTGFLCPKIFLSRTIYVGTLLLSKRRERGPTDVIPVYWGGTVEKTEFLDPRVPCPFGKTESRLPRLPNVATVGHSWPQMATTWTNVAKTWTKVAKQPSVLML